MKKLYKKLICLLFILFIGIQIYAQTKISGSVKSKDGEILAGVNLAIEGSYDGSSSDANGKFSFVTEEKGNHVLKVSTMGYETFSKPVNLNGSKIVLEIKLVEKANLLNTVQVNVGSFEAGDQKKGLMLSSLDVATTAGSNADIVAALQTLPGTQPASNSTGLFVRGGEASETKTWFDGMLIKNPNFSDLPDISQRGRFSPFLFKGTNFSSGAYSAEFGQGLSSALQLDSKDLPDKSSTDVSLMIVGAGLMRTNRYKNSSLTAGYSYINLRPAFFVVHQSTHWTLPPISQDGTLEYKLKTSNTGLLKLYADYSYSRVGLDLPNENDTSNKTAFRLPSVLNNNSRNLYSNATYQEYLNPNWKIQAGFSYSSDNVSGSFDRFKYGNIQRLAQYKLTSTHFIGKWSSIKYGIHEFNETYHTVFDSLSKGYTDNLWTGFAEGQFFITQKLALRLGVHAEYSSLQNQSYLSPRSSLSYRLDKKSQIAAAYGTFSEQPQEIFLVHNNTLGSEQAAHYLLNYQYMANDRILRVEAYYKKYSNLVKAEQPFSVPIYNNGYAYGSPAQSNFNGVFDNTGYGYARGIDFFFRDKHSIKGADYWVSYSFLDSKRNYRFYNSLATPTFAGRNTLNLVYKQYVSSVHTQFSGTFTYASGRTYYDPSSLVFLGSKTPDYKNLSVSASYLTSILKSFTVIFVSLGNVPGFKNVYGYHYSDSGKMEAIKPPSLRSFFVGMFLTFGDTRPLD